MGLERRPWQHAFKHADFGVSGNPNNASFQQFGGAITKHVNTPGTRAIAGEHGGLAYVAHFVDPKTSLNVVRDASGSSFNQLEDQPRAARTRAEHR